MLVELGDATDTTDSTDTTDATDAARCGTKAATLARLRRAGFAVPDGVVLPVDVVATVVGVDERETPLLDRIVATLPGPWAVRSSGTAEDGPEASYAGQFDTVLGVEGIDALREAVRTCAASARSARARTYRAGENQPLAVLVQTMVPADVAGVAFTVDPVAGDPDQARVSAIRGLGDRLVDGVAPAEEWVVHAGVATCEQDDPKVLGPDEALAVAALAGRVAAVEERPQDIEWARAGGRLWLLQARPITTLTPSTTAPIPPEGFWTRAENAPRPLSAMARSVLLPTFAAAGAGFFRYTFAAGVDFEVLGGRLYSRYTPLTDPDALRERAERIVAAARGGEPARTVEGWYAGTEPDTAGELAAIRAVDLPALADGELRTHLARVRALREWLLTAHFDVAGAAGYVVGELGAFLAARGVDDPATVLATVSGTGGATAATGAALDELARSDASTSEAVAAYQARHGRRTLGFDLDEPTLAERPDVVAELITRRRERTAPPTDAADAPDRAARAAAEARRALPATDRERFDVLLARARRAYPLRDDSEVRRHEAEAELRYVLLEIGRRLAARGAVTQPADVMLLAVEEALTSLDAGTSRVDTVRERAAAARATAASPPPATLGTPPSGPPPRPPAPAGDGDPHPLAAVAWSGRAMAPSRAPSDADDPDVVAGLAASAGHYRGPVRLVHDEAGFGRVRAGDVLVAPTTGAQWSVLFGLVGALVTDTGSLLSHPAIIAREYGVPAVVATRCATSTLRDGDIVEVDGHRGRVRRVS